MDNQNQQPTQNTDQLTPPSPEAQTGSPIVKNTNPITSIFSKLYSNKLIFWSLSIFIVIVLFIVIVGTLFGKRGTPVTATPKTTKAPFVLPSPNATPSIEVLSNSQQKINSLRKQIEEMDVRQNRLQPPIVDFDIKF